MPSSDKWLPMGLGSSLERSPSAIVPAPVIGQLDGLPFDLLSWEDFERLQWRVMRDVEGLRHARLYGERGQKQQGLDVVALAPDGTGAALQSKRYKSFGAADLEAAVEKFRTTRRPFDVQRLIVGVSKEVKDTASIQSLGKLRRELHPVQLDLWDGSELSVLLSRAPAIVIDFFGLETAQRFCQPFALDPIVVPSANAVAIREAMARSPEETTGAAQLLAEAEAVSAEPERALQLVELAQARLREAGFEAYAGQHEGRRGQLLAALDRGEEAIRDALDELWLSMDQGLVTTAQSTHHRLRELLSTVTASARLAEFVRVAESALDLYLHPLGELPDPQSLLIGDPVDRVRLAVLAGESALANDNPDWLVDAQPLLASLADITDVDRVLRTRLRLLLAESTGDWAVILDEALKLRLGYDLRGLVQARYARYCAVNQRFEEAEALWGDAAGDACLAGRWADAYTWVLSRRAFRGRWKPFTSNELLPLQIAMRDLGPAKTIVPLDEHAYENALDDLRRHKLRPSATAGQRALRDAVATGDWVGEDRSRRVLAAVLIESGELEPAARHLTRAGDVDAVKELGKSHSKHFVDVTADLQAPNYWTVGTAYRLIAEQADLIPDAVVGQVADRITAELQGAENGTLADLRAFAPSRYLGAVAALAGIGHRLTPEQAELALAHFERQPPVDENHYRYHDENEATTVARIAESHAALRQRALNHLIALLARSQSARNNNTSQTISTYVEIARDELNRAAADGNRWAQEVIAFHDPESIDPSVADEALDRLATPLIHTPGVFTSGTSAVGDSLLVGNLPPARREVALEELLRRANDPQVGSSDRCDYLIAASNLVHDLADDARSKHFAAAVSSVSAPMASKHDEFEERFRHPLGSLQIRNADRDSRDRAVFLAARLATGEAQRTEVRNLAYALLGSGSGTGSDYWPTQALQRLGREFLKDDIGLLVAQGWAPRSLAAILWAEYGRPVHVGMRLADDADVRVRRALAEALALAEPQELQRDARALLERDPSYSVRAAIHGNVVPASSTT